MTCTNRLKTEQRTILALKITTNLLLKELNMITENKGVSLTKTKNKAAAITMAVEQVDLELPCTSKKISLSLRFWNR